MVEWRTKGADREWPAKLAIAERVRARRCADRWWGGGKLNLKKCQSYWEK